MPAQPLWKFGRSAGRWMRVVGVVVVGGLVTGGWLVHGMAGGTLCWWRWWGEGMSWFGGWNEWWGTFHRKRLYGSDQYVGSEPSLSHFHSTTLSYMYIYIYPQPPMTCIRFFFGGIIVIIINVIITY